MTDGLNRTALVQLLEKLGSKKDEETLQAARDIHGMVTAGGASWDDLLVSEDRPVEPADEAPEEDSQAHSGSDSIPPDNAESLRLVERLMALSDLSDSLREELEGYRDDIAEKEFDAADRKYLLALHQRLTK